MPFDDTDNIGALAVGFQYIIPVTDDYQVRVVDDIIVCDGTFDVTLPPKTIVKKSVTIISTNGTITLLADADIETPSTLTNGTAETFALAFDKWWHM